MAKSPKPKEMQADAVLDDAGPVAEVAALPEPVAEVAALPEPVAEVAALPGPVAGAALDPGPAPNAPVDPAGWKLRVRALQPSRWRAGRRFGPEPVEIDVADLTGAERMALMQDILLSVDVIAPEGKATDPASGD